MVLGKAQKRNFRHSGLDSVSRIFEEFRIQVVIGVTIMENFS